MTKPWLAVVWAICCILGGVGRVAAATPPNVLVFPVDDMDFATLNINGCPVKGLTPNMDRLAREGLQFACAHLNSAVCQPSRQSMMTGKHTHRNGTLGFIPVPKGVANLSEMLLANGWFTASFNKGRDYVSFPWSEFLAGYGGQGFGRDPEAFEKSTREAILRARQAAQPFFINVATSDPHRVFAGSDDEKAFLDHWKELSPKGAAEGKIFMPPFEDMCTAQQAWVPPYLPDLPAIRREWAQYYNTVHRADQTLGRILDLLEEEGLAKNTVVIFFSDNGASFPTSKQNCYPYSTQTPLIVRWPGVVRPGSVDRTHMVSTMDIMPTVLEIAGVAIPGDLDGRSLVGLLKGGGQTNRDRAFTTYNYIHPGLQVFPMRAVHTRGYSYIFNAWADGKRKFTGEPLSGLTFAAMREAAKTDPAMARRVKHVEYRIREELYNVTNDPWCLHNLIDDAKHAAARSKMKKLMETEMRRTNDPLLPSFLGTGRIPPEWFKAVPQPSTE